MRKPIKIVSIFMSLALLFTSCGKSSVQAVTENTKKYFDNNDYNGCISYLNSIDASVKSSVSSTVLELVIDEFTEIYSPFSNIDQFDISSIDTSFIENCVKLWNIASMFTPNDEINFNESLIKLRYFSELSDTLRYRELFIMLKDMHNCGYFYSLQKALNDYEVLGEFDEFEKLQKIASNFKYNEYNPQEFLISELRTSCDKINKYLTSANNGFATNDTTVIASSISNIYSIASDYLYACDYVKAVYSSMNDLMNTLTLEGAFADYKSEINVQTRSEYSAGTDFALSQVFNNDYTPPTDSNSNESANNVSNLSKQDAIRIAVNAINKTKGYGNTVTVERAQNVNVQMTGFKTESEITTAVSLVKVKINDALKSSNGTSKGSRTYVNGVSGDLSLYDSVPPSGRSASLDPSLVESYTAVKGSGGYVITFTLRPCTSTNEDLSYSLLSIVDGFYFDEDATDMDHKTSYSPTNISLVVSNYGYLSKYSYTINGVSDCKFYENDEHVATGEFSFNYQYDYNFTY